MTKTTKDLPPVGSTGTLAELQVGPGDVVFMVECPDKKMTVCEIPPRKHNFEDHWLLECEKTGGGLYFNEIFTLISRAMPQAPHIITHEGRTYDLTALETPLGLLPKPVRGALQKWPHGVEVYTGGEWKSLERPPWLGNAVYRARPAPVETRVNCARFGHGEPYEYGTCIKRADGSIDWATWEGDE